MTDFVKIAFLATLVLCLHEAEAEKYPDGRAFPSRSLEYVKMKFKEINPELIWDNRNYLEAMAADYASCNYPEEIVYGYANIPDNTSFVVFVEYQDLPGHAKSDVIKNLEPVVNNWVEKKRYNTQIGNASIFACSVSPGCGRREDRMGVSCVFSPSSKPYVYNPDDYPDEPENIEEQAEPEPEPLTPDQYDRGGELTDSNWNKNKFLENLSLLETNCSLVGKDSWDFEKAKSIVNGLGLKISGAFGTAEIPSSNVDPALDSIFKQMKRELPQNVQIGCSLIRNCFVESKEFAVSTCVYEEKCRREICL